jgi:hypothetical protein
MISGRADYNSRSLHIAISMPSVWAKLEKNFKPIYSRKIIEALLAKEGGIIRSVAKFHRSEDESKTYRRMLLSGPRTDSDGNEIVMPPPDLVSRRCLLVPGKLFSDFLASWDSQPSYQPLPQSHQKMVTAVM